MARVIDPVCGTQLASETASTSLAYGGHTYFFCAPACRQKFEEDPESYRSASPAVEDGTRVQMERHEPPVTTTGWFTAPKFGSAGSGGLEFELLPEAHDDHSPA